MRKLGIAPVAAITVGLALPAAAQVGFYAGPGGAGVEIGAPGYYEYDPYYVHRPYHRWRHEYHLRRW